jgi:hypothetical protein
VKRALLCAWVFAGSLAWADAPVPPPWGDGKKLGQKIVLEDTRVCADASGHVVVVTPKELRDSRTQYYSGTAAELAASPEGNGTLFDHRQTNSVARVVVEGEQCVITCGERVVKLPLMKQEQAVALLLAARYVPRPHQRVPYSLLRDTKGNYYFVDRSRLPGEEKNFRLYVGPKGNLVLQKMTNVVNDTTGDIFSTKSGDLRLLIDREKTSEWVAGGARTPLRLVPVDENLHLIYAELGVYAGQRLGTPCDDL